MTEEKPKMGRPPKAKEPEIELKSEAYGIARDKNGAYYLVVLKYDMESGKSEIVERLLQGDRSEAFQRFQIRVAQSEIMG